MFAFRNMCLVDNFSIPVVQDFIWRCRHSILEVCKADCYWLARGFHHQIMIALLGLNRFAYEHDLYSKVKIIYCITLNDWLFPFAGCGLQRLFDWSDVVVASVYLVAATCAENVVKWFWIHYLSSAPHDSTVLHLMFRLSKCFVESTIMIQTVIVFFLIEINQLFTKMNRLPRCHILFVIHLYVVVIQNQNQKLFLPYI